MHAKRMILYLFERSELALSNKLKIIQIGSVLAFWTIGLLDHWTIGLLDLVHSNSIKIWTIGL